MTFLLNCGVSMLTGTAFGTAATMGTICVSVGMSMGMDPVLLGGAMLSGVFSATAARRSQRARCL